MQNENFPNPDAMFSGDLSTEDLRIKIIGMGGAGSNALDRLKLDDLSEVHLATVNTDMQALQNSLASEKIMIGRGVTRGLGTGGDQVLGRTAAEADRSLLEKAVAGQDLVFLVVGLGGGTGSGAAPYLAELAVDAGALVIAFVMLPFNFEGNRRRNVANDALEALRKTCDAVIALPNDILLQEEEDGSDPDGPRAEASFLDAFAKADSWVCGGVKAICWMLLKTGLINLDFTSLRQVFVEKGGKTLFGLGRGEGADAYEQALNNLFLCPLIHSPECSRRADNLLVQISGGTDLTMKRVHEMMAAITEKVGGRANTCLGALIDEGMQQKLEICIIGTSNLNPKKGYRPPPAAAVSHNAEPDKNPGDADRRVDRNGFRVHESTLRSKRRQATMWDQDEFEFLADDEQRGYFDRTERNLYDGEDLDVPTYLRRGLKISLRA